MLYLNGIGHFHPENVISNGFLESLEIGTDETWILDRVGIANRRTVLDLDYIRHTRNADPRAAAEASTHTNAETGAMAARMAMARAGRPGRRDRGVSLFVLRLALASPPPPRSGPG